MSDDELDLIPLYREMADGGASFRGLTVLQYKNQIKALVRRYGVVTMLDFGSGAGDAYRSPTKFHDMLRLKRMSVTLYDPAFPQHSELPQRKFDMVICSDVLEHVPEAKVDALIDTIFSRAKKVVWASVCCRPARKCFPGTEINLHCTVQPFTWWEARFKVASERYNVPGDLIESP